MLHHHPTCTRAQVGGVADPASRYRIVFPENHARLPAHLSTAAKLLASPRALKRLRASVAGRMGYVVPGVVGDEEVDLAVALGLPLMSPVPYTARWVMCGAEDSESSRIGQLTTSE